MSNARVLVVDDEPQILRAVQIKLRAAGYAVDTAATAEDALMKAGMRPPAAVILDVLLPDGRGTDVCRELRTWYGGPIVVLSAVGEEREKIDALDAGADDYVTKPFSPRELAVRVQTVLRRAAPPSSSARRIELDGLTIDPRTREVERDGEALRLTAKEFDLLYFLASNPRQVFSRDQLMGRVWGYEAAVDTGTVTVHMRRLRAKIERDPSNPRHLETVWGVGYRFVP